MAIRIASGKICAHSLNRLQQVAIHSLFDLLQGARLIGQVDSAPADRFREKIGNRWSATGKRFTSYGAD